MLLRLTSLRALDSEVFEDLFFTNLIGQVEIDNVIPYILRLGGAGVSIIIKGQRSGRSYRICIFLCRSKLKIKQNLDNGRFEFNCNVEHVFL